MLQLATSYKVNEEERKNEKKMFEREREMQNCTYFDCIDVSA